MLPGVRLRNLIENPLVVQQWNIHEYTGISWQKACCAAYFQPAPPWPPPWVLSSQPQNPQCDGWALQDCTSTSQLGSRIPQTSLDKWWILMRNATEMLKLQTSIFKLCPSPSSAFWPLHLHMSFPRHRCAIGRYRRGFEQESAHFAQAFSQAQTSGWSLNCIRPWTGRSAEVDIVVWFGTYFSYTSCIWSKLQEQDSNRTPKCSQLSAFNNQ